MPLLLNSYIPINSQQERESLSPSLHSFLCVKACGARLELQSQRHRLHAL